VVADGAVLTEPEDVAGAVAEGAVDPLVAAAPEVAGGLVDVLLDELPLEQAAADSAIAPTAAPTRVLRRSMGTSPYRSAPLCRQIDNSEYFPCMTGLVGPSR
jgi:hypothetical protein